MERKEINMYQINPYTNKKYTIVKNGVAVRDYWCTDWKGNRHHVSKGTRVNENGLPINEKEKR